METGILPPELKSIEQLFAGDSRFSVPKYQRNFAWRSDETEELWEDVLSAVLRKGDYFLGTIVLHRRSPGSLEIIDGQQRLACVSMIFSAIRNLFLSNRDERANQIARDFLGAKGYSRDATLTPKLVLNKINNETFVQYIIDSKNLTDVEKALRSKVLHESNRILLQAYKYFLTTISSEAAKRGTEADDFVVPLIDCLRSSIKLITIPVTTEEDANLFFESLNARGKELAISDLVKNRLYMEAGSQVSRAEQLWEKMEAELIRRPIPEYLRHYWIAKRVEADNLTVREKQLYRMISQDIKGKQPAAIKLLEDLQKTAADYVKIWDYSLWPDDDAYGNSFEEALRELRLFRVTQCNPLLLMAIQKFRKARDVARTFRIVANFSFRYFIIGNQSPGNLEREAGKIAFDIRKGNYSGPAHIADALRAINPDPTFRSDFSLAKISPARAKLGRHVLAKLNNFMQKQSAATGAEMIANPDAKQVTLEHILPQSLPNAWVGGFAKSADAADFVHRIGNLTLLTAKINRRDAADKSFTAKQEIALNGSKLPLNEYFKIHKNWSDKEIEERQEKLAKVALEVWKL